jgi:mannose-1-phosphate guanylyltransferase / mannose-6-phosphate isomerase
MEIIPIILCGGVGQRLFPLSTPECPKAFVRPFGGEHNMLQATLLRLVAAGFRERPLIVAAQSTDDLLMSSLEQIGQGADILLEPVRRNTCAAVALGIKHALNRSPESLSLVLAVDHHIPDTLAFGEGIRAATSVAASDYIVTFGIIPTEPATGYGYIKVGERIEQSDVCKVTRFHEKPDTETALKLLAAGYLWNSGNFLMKTRCGWEVLKELEPEVAIPAQNALESAEYRVLSNAISVWTVAESIFAQAPALSFDRAILEKSLRVAVLPLNLHWRDLGTVAAIQEANEDLTRFKP